MGRRGTPHSNQLRIIGGRWRGRKLQFPDRPGLRPTSDRVRETLFNWLQHEIQDARCLDLFAGAGALGIEALSRGAQHCDFIDLDPIAASSIQTHLQTLGGHGISAVHCCEALSWLDTHVSHPWDVIFIDPPFDGALIARTLQRLIHHSALSDSTLVYVELARTDPLAFNSKQWETLRQKQAGEVQFRLLRRGGQWHTGDDA
jgi:16S rRNA (guanine966-N2)-methyltransferase